MHPERAFKVENVFIPWKFMTSRNMAKYDYALLKLEKKFESKDFIPLSGKWSELDKESKIFVGGYPRV